MLRRERTELSDLVQQAEALRADNAALHRRSLQLPGLQEENARLKVRGPGRGAWPRDAQSIRL